MIVLAISETFDPLSVGQHIGELSVSYMPKGYWRATYQWIICELHISR